MAKSFPFLLPFKNRIIYSDVLQHCKLSYFASLNQKLKEAIEVENKLTSDVKNDSKSDILRNSLKRPDFFSMAELFTVEDLFKANVHLGHRDGTLCSYMKPYILGSRLGYLIFDLDQTCSLLRDALNFTAHIAFRGGIILFLGRSPQHQSLIDNTAEKCKEFSHTKPWDPRTFTAAASFYDKGVRLPDLMIFLSTKNDVLAEHAAIKDAARLLIPSVGIVDTNSDPRLISYPVPGNDDSMSAVELYCKLFSQAILRGKSKRKQLLEQT